MTNDRPELLGWVWLGNWSRGQVSKVGVGYIIVVLSTYQGIGEPSKRNRIKKPSTISHISGVHPLILFILSYPNRQSGELGSQILILSPLNHANALSNALMKSDNPTGDLRSHLCAPHTPAMSSISSRAPSLRFSAIMPASLTNGVGHMLQEVRNGFSPVLRPRC